MLTRAWLFVKRAGTVILAISIILWALMYFPRSDQPTAISDKPAVATLDGVTTDNDQRSTINDPTPETEQLRNSFAGKLGHLIEPAIRPLGFDWKIGVALIASFAAREVLVSTLSIIYNVGYSKCEGRQWSYRLDAAYSSHADGVFCARDAVHVDGGDRAS
jgi:ferrous iron transport protein B